MWASRAGSIRLAFGGITFGFWGYNGTSDGSQRAGWAVLPPPSLLSPPLAECPARRQATQRDAGGDVGEMQV